MQKMVSTQSNLHVVTFGTEPKPEPANRCAAVSPLQPIFQKMQRDIGALPRAMRSTLAFYCVSPSVGVI